MEKETQKKNSKKELILKGALKVFCEKGFEATTVDDITKKAGCSHGLFYHYYKSKKEVFDEIVSWNIEETMRDFFQQLNNATGYSKKLETMIDFFTTKVCEDETYYYYFYFLISQLFTLKEKGISPTSQKKQRPVINLKGFFEEGQLAGEFTTDFSSTECVSLFISIILGGFLSYIISPKEIQMNLDKPNAKTIVSIFTKRSD